MVQFIKRMMGATGIALVCVLAMPVAQAGPWDFTPSVRDGGRQESFQGQRGNRPAEERRQTNQRDDGREARRAQRMSPEERQQLRRDIKDAGREVYMPRR